MKKENTIKLYNPDFVLEIKQIVAQARQKAYAAINSAMIDAYWQMGKRIVEQEQFGKERADYGAQLLKSLSKELTTEFGKGFSVNSLYYFRQFHLAFPEKLPTLWGILTWSHYKRLLSVSNADAHAWYLKEAARQMWSYRTLDRNIGSQYYERLLLSQHKDTVESEMKTLTKPFEQDRMEFIKNPTVAEFIGLAPNSDFSETELEGGQQKHFWWGFLFAVQNRFARLWREEGGEIMGAMQFCFEEKGRRANRCASDGDFGSLGKTDLQVQRPHATSTAASLRNSVLSENDRWPMGGHA